MTAKVCVYLLAKELILDANPSFSFSFLSRISDQLCVNIQSVALGFPYSFMVLPIAGRLVHPFVFHVVNTKTQS